MDTSICAMHSIIYSVFCSLLIAARVRNAPDLFTISKMVSRANEGAKDVIFCVCKSLNEEYEWPQTYRVSKIEGSVMIITGASSGLGREIAILFSKHHLRLILTGRSIDRLNHTKRSCSQNSTVDIFQADITSNQECGKIVSFAIQKYSKLDILVLNAGINAHFRFEDLKETSIFQTIMNTNFHSNVHLTLLALPHLKKSEGKIIVISSLSGKFGLPQRSAYCASKFALNGFFESLRIEEPKLSITMVYPTSLNTPMRSNNLMKNQNESQDHSKQQDPKDCARMIEKGIASGKEDVYVPSKGKLGVILMPLFPAFMRKKLNEAAKL